jgi:ligand-binding sensor domain-containing protein/signal transduction histidine kinase
MFFYVFHLKWTRQSKIAVGFFPTSLADTPPDACRNGRFCLVLPDNSGTIRQMANSSGLGQMLAETRTWRATLRGMLRAAVCLVLCLFCWVFATPMARANYWDEVADTVFRQFNADHGLPHGTVTSLVEDHEGFIWVGTQDGLARWDGYRFHVYAANPADRTALPDGFINCLYVDQHGQLWVGTNSGGLARYVREQDHFETIATGAGGVSHVTITALADDGQGGLWVGTENGLNYLNAQHKVLSPPPWIGKLPDFRIRSILRSRDSALWIGSRVGLIRIDADGSTQTIAFPAQDGAIPTPTIARLMQASDGVIWIGSALLGVFTVDGQRQAQPPTARPVALPTDSAFQSINAMLELRPGLIWLGTIRGGIITLEGPEHRVRQIRHDACLPVSLADDGIWALLRDRSGGVWVGNGRGLGYLAVQQPAVQSWFGIAGRTDRLSDPDVNMLQVDSRGRVWMVLGDRSLTIIDPASPASKSSPASAMQRWKPPKGEVAWLAPAPDGAMYVLTDAALYRAEPGRTTLRELALPPSSRPPVGNAALKVNETLFSGAGIFVVEPNGIWLGGNAGLWRIELDAQGRIRDWYSEALDQLTDRRVNSILRTAPDQLWVGTEHGLNLINPQTHKVEQILSNRTDPSTLGPGPTTSLLFDSRQRMWISSMGGGVSLLEGRGPDGRLRFRRFGREHGLPDRNVNKLLEDASGNIWGSTDDGLAQIDGKTLHVQALRRTDGVPISAYWTNAGAVTPNHELLFGGADGLTVLFPGRLALGNYQPPLVVVGAQVGGRAVPIDTLNGPNPVALTIVPKTNQVSVEFAALDYSAPERNLYAYRLEGYDNLWVNADAAHRQANYANLPPGEYRLQLRGSNRSGVFSPLTREIRIQVLPAWYQTWWWRICEVLAGLLLLGLLVQVRTRFLRNRQLELQSQVRHRTIELRQKQKELVEANQELAQTADTLRLMGDVGRDITANLEQDAVFDALYTHVSGLLDVAGMTIYRLNDAQQTLDCCFARENGKDLPHPQIALASTDSNAVRAVREQHEILIESALAEPAPGHVPGTLVLQTAIFAPLMVGPRVVGAMSVQSARVRAYGERERLIFRTVCAYGAIALSNAQALDALHQAQRQLMQQEKMASLGGLVSGVAHEVNTPLGNTLTALSGVIEILQHQDDALKSHHLTQDSLQTWTDESLEYARLAQGTALRVVELVNSFKAVAAPSGVDQAFNIKLEQYLPEVLALVRSTLEHGGGRILVDVQPNLVLRIVPEALTEALTRILANVVAHAWPDGSHGLVQIRALREADGSVLISVIDDGCGIAAQDLPKVFDPFFTTKSGLGNHVGLGLHIAYNHVVQRLHGTLSIVSAPGAGTTVNIRLPASCCL